MSYLCCRLRETDENGHRQSLPADNFVRFAVVLGISLSVLALIQIILVGVFKNLSDQTFLAWELAPNFAVGLGIVSIVLNFLIHPVGLFGVLTENRKAAYLFFWASFPVAAILLVMFVVLLMSGNGVAAVESRRIDSNDLEDNEMGLNSFSDKTQDNIVRFALANPEVWKNIQDDLGCCGLNVRTLFSNSTLSDVDIDVKSELLTGIQCTLFENEVDDLFAAIGNDFDREALQDPAIFNEDDFPRLASVAGLCGVALAGETRSVAQQYSIMFGLQSFFHVAQMVVIGLLIYSYEEHEGGLKPDEDSLEMQAKVENTVIAKAGYQSGAFGGEKPKFGTRPRTAQLRFG